MEWSAVIGFAIGVVISLYGHWIVAGHLNWREGMCFAIGTILILYISPALMEIYPLPNSGMGSLWTDIITTVRTLRMWIALAVGIWFFYLAWLAYRDDIHVDSMFWWHRNVAAAAAAAPPPGPGGGPIPPPVPPAPLPSDFQRGAFRFLIIMGFVFLFLSGVHYYLLFNPLLRQLQAVSTGVPIEVRLNVGEPGIVIQFPLSLSKQENNEWKARVEERLKKLDVTMENLEIVYVAAVLQDGWRINSFAVGFRGNKKEGNLPAEPVESRLDFENNMSREATDAWLNQLINVHRPLVKQIITPPGPVNVQQNVPGSSFLPPTPSSLKRL